MILNKNSFGIFCLLILLGLAALNSPTWAQPISHLKLDAHRVLWTQLSFHAKNFWVEVSTRVELKSFPGADVEAVLLSSPKGAPIKTAKAATYQMTIDTTLDPRFQPKVNIHNKIWFNPEDAAALGRVRLRLGGDHFKKMYRFTDKGVFRHRIEPKDQAEASLAPDQWTAVKDSFYSYDLNRLGCPFVTERSLLVFILSALDFSNGEDPLSLCVFGKRQLHWVQIQKQGLQALSVNYIEKKQQSTVRKQGTIDALKISIMSKPMDSGSKQAENFSFLGFHNNIVIYIEPTAGLPIQAEGDIPTIGKAQLKLNEVKWRPKSE